VEGALSGQRSGSGAMRRKEHPARGRAMSLRCRNDRYRRCGSPATPAPSCVPEINHKEDPVRELRVDMFSTVDGYGGSNPPDAPYWGYGAPGLFEWIHGVLAEDHVMLMGATT
jgi:hypothetical protein